MDHVQQNIYDENGKISFLYCLQTTVVIYTISEDGCTG